MYKTEIETNVLDYISNSGMDREDWDIDNLVDAISAYMDAHSIATTENIPEDDWSELFQLFDISED